MNCANHPDRSPTAFCQNCGKPLCAQCTRMADGLVLCEPCLMGRIPAGSEPVSRASAAATGGFTSVDAAANSGTQAGQVGYRHVPGTPTQPYQPMSSGSPSPIGAGFLGLIPGVGAMYNGQFVKALLHVIIFVVLVGASERFKVVGLLLAFWILYQIFDAVQTAVARRDGLPLPDPFGILDMSQRIGPQSSIYPPIPYTAPARPPVQAAAAAAQTAWTANATASSVDRSDRPDQQQEARWQTPAAPYVPAPPPVPVPPALARRSEPIGAIVLILVGLLFLMSTLGFLDFDWIGRGWPVLLMLLGVWLLIRRASTPVPPMSQGFQGFNTAAPVHPVSPTSVRDTASQIVDEPIAHSPIHPDPISKEEQR